MFCPLCASELATVATRSEGEQVVMARHYCTPCDMFFVWHHEKNTLVVEHGAEFWMREQMAVVEGRRQMALAFDGNSKRQPQRAALVVVGGSR